MAFKLEKPPHREILGGDLLAQSLKQLGTDVAFGLHGGHLDAFLVGAHEAGIRLVDTRHETTAVQAAEGYAKIAGKVGVCFVTANSGYGLLNVTMNVAYTASASRMASLASRQLSQIDRPSSASPRARRFKKPKRTHFRAFTIRS